VREKLIEYSQVFCCFKKTSHSLVLFSIKYLLFYFCFRF
jgi:hypothetical protein